MSGHHASSTALAAWLSALAIFTILLSGTAFAGTKTMAIHTVDLDLTTEAGRTVLRQRITRAVEHVCGTPYELTLAEIPAYEKCSKPALAGAMSQYDMAVAAAQNAREVAGDAASRRPVR